MIALVATFLIAAYVLGPSLVARWVLGFVVPPKNLAQTRSEEITRGILWSILPLTLAWLLRHVGPLALAANSRVDLQTFFSGIYSEPYFSQHRAEFFAAADSFLLLNACLLVRLYGIVLVGSALLNYLITKFGVLRSWMGTRPFWSKLRPLLATIVLPRISEWHVILSSILLPSNDMKIEVDILTRSGTLYQGLLAGKVIASDGSLQSVTLGEPRRFRRAEYLEERKTDPEVDLKKFWKAIPGNLFVIVAADIATLNVRYIPATVRRFGREFSEIAAAIKQLDLRLQRIQSEKESRER